MSAVVIAIAHRGDPVTRLENTIAAFDSAVLAGADMVELDLQRSRDGEIIVVHDATLSRLWGVDRAVSSLDLVEIQTIGGTSPGIPTLREVLERLSIPLMVDFTGEEVVPGAVQVVRQARGMERSLFVTGNVDALRALRAVAPEARIGLTWTKPELPSSRLLHELDAEFWNPEFGLVSTEWVERIHALGPKVSTWTVDETSDMERVIGAGIDAIVSNRIRELVRVVSNGLVGGC
jgi:glycerophosphoryl diester phosphodiesterase